MPPYRSTRWGPHPSQTMRAEPSSASALCIRSALKSGNAQLRREASIHEEGRALGRSRGHATGFFWLKSPGTRPAEAEAPKRSSFFLVSVSALAQRGGDAARQPLTLPSHHSLQRLSWTAAVWWHLQRPVQRLDFPVCSTRFLTPSSSPSWGCAAVPSAWHEAHQRRTCTAGAASRSGGASTPATPDTPSTPSVSPRPSSQAGADTPRVSPRSSSQAGADREAPSAPQRKSPAAPLLVFGSDGRLQLTKTPPQDGPAPPSSFPSPPQAASGGSSSGSRPRQVQGAGTAQGARKGKPLRPAVGSMDAPESEVAWKQGAPGRVKKQPPQKPPAPPKYSKAARRFYNDNFRETERLSKVLAAAGVASRRACEDMIFAGRVTLNGDVCLVPQTAVDLGRDSIYVDGRSLPKKMPPKFYFLVNKPKGYICSGTSESGKTAISILDEYMGVWRKRNAGVPPPRLFTVGRLDVATTGLLLITNDGAFAQRVAHPSSGLTKEYIATVGERVTRRQLSLMGQGVEVEGALCVPVLVEVVEETGAEKGKDGKPRERLRVVVAEGRNREVRRIIEAAGLTVINLKRVRIGSLRLPRDLGIGKYKVLDASEAEKVAKDVAL